MGSGEHALQALEVGLRFGLQQRTPVLLARVLPPVAVSVNGSKAQGAQVIEVDTDGIYFVPSIVGRPSRPPSPTPGGQNARPTIENLSGRARKRTAARHRGRAQRAILGDVQL